MAFLKSTHVSGNLFVTGSENYVSASEFRGPLIGTASEAAHAVSASHASALDPNFDLRVKTLVVSGSAQVNGDLKVLGDLTYVGVKDLRVKDHQIELNVDESGSAQQSADGAGIIMRGTDTDVELIYSSSDDKLHINKTIAGTIDSASRAVSAAEADKVAHKVTFKLKNEDGTSASDVEFDGSAAKDFSVDLSALASKAALATASANLQDQIDAITGGGSGSIDEKIETAINALDADASANASGTAVSGGVFVLTGVAINEANGKLTSGSATSVEVDPAGAASKALVSAKAYADEKYASASANLEAFSSSVATDFSASDAARVALSASLSQSIAAVEAKADNGLDLVESSSYIAVSAKSSKKQTISAKTANVADASATGTDGLAVASDVKSYVDAQVGGKNVDAVGDEYINLNATNNVVTGSATIKKIAEATAEKQGLVDAYDAKLHVSASVAALSSSAASALNTYSSSAAVALANAAATSSASLSAFSASVATDFTNAKSDLTATASALDSRIDALETASAAAYVKKSGDTMTGDLNMGSNGIILGDMKLVYVSGAIQFVYIGE